MQEPRSTDQPRKETETSEFLEALKKGLLLGAVLLLVIVPPLKWMQGRDAPETPVVTAPQPPLAAPEMAPPAAPPQMPGVQLADFRGEDPSPDALHVANWVVHSRNNKNHAFVVVDKKDARVYVFSPSGKLKDSAPALMGSARGDDSYPGIGDKPLKLIQPYEKTTPAGRFVAEMGMNANQEDVVWVDYDAAVSMHRIRPTNPKERRLERLASLTTDDNRISFGCINLPITFYESVLRPTVKKYGAVVYVLPEVKSVQQVFGSYDVTDAMQQASAKPARRAAKVQRVALQANR